VQLKRFDFTLSTSIVKAGENIYTKIIKIQPTYVVVNQSCCALEIVQHNAHDDLIGNRFWPPGEKREWYWADPS
jgi:hypothetical protein